MYIYKITNKLTGQGYVGQTSDPFKRWHTHSCSYDSPIQRAIHELGITNFIFEVLEICDDAEANNRETFWIQYYHTYGQGYNTNRGEGEKTDETIIINPPPQARIHRGKSSASPVEALDPKTGEVLYRFNTIREAQDFCNCGNAGNISAVCRGRGRTAYGYGWRYAQKT